jgi:hypothetical protein
MKLDEDEIYIQIVALDAIWSFIVMRVFLLKTIYSLKILF